MVQSRAEIMDMDNRNHPLDALRSMGTGQSSGKAVDQLKCQKAKKLTKHRKKARDAPKRFKSSYIFFVQEKHKAMQTEMLKAGMKRGMKNVETVTKRLSSAWRALSPSERSVYEEMAKKDKLRYEMEKDIYRGPWTVSMGYKITHEASAPRKPRSAYFAWANKRRSSLKKKMPHATNGELSKMLARKWKELEPEIKERYQTEERELRAKYNQDMAKWQEAENARLHERKQEAMRLAQTSMDGFPAATKQACENSLSSEETGKGGAVHPQEVPSYASLKRSSAVVSPDLTALVAEDHKILGFPQNAALVNENQSSRASSTPVAPLHIPSNPADMKIKSADELTAGAVGQSTALNNLRSIVQREILQAQQEAEAARRKMLYEQAVWNNLIHTGVGKQGLNLLLNSASSLQPCACNLGMEVAAASQFAKFHHALRVAQTGTPLQLFQNNSSTIS